YPTQLFGLATGQSLNIFMSVLGLVLWVWFQRRALTRRFAPPSASGEGWGEGRLLPRRFIFAAILLICLIMPSDWTQDVPRRYGKRHPGLHYSRMYPPV